MAVAVAALVITGGWNVMTKVSDWFPVPPALIAEIVMLFVDAVVGLPEITPVVGSRLTPAGKPVAPKEVGLSVAVML